MSEDLKRGLLAGKQTAFDRMHEECVGKIRLIKEKNNYMQRQAGIELDDTVKEEVRNQRTFVETEIKELRQLMDEMEKKFKDLQSKNRLKELKTEAQRQIERNRIILKDFINKSFIVRGPVQDEEKYIADYVEVAVKEEPQESMLTDQQLDFDLQRRMLKEKAAMIDDVEQATLRINDIMNDVAIMVDDQGDNLNIIDAEMVNAHQNVVAANQNLVQANTLQRKSKKKYIILLVIIVIVAAAVTGIVFIAT